MATACRLIIDPPAAGAWNMALDEALLDSTAKEGQQQATLRFYQWEKPTLSLGYFQSHADRQRHVASKTCTMVRRSSGGGALIHDHELTYSLALPASHPMAENAVGLTCEAHRALREAIIELASQSSQELADQLSHRLSLCEPAAIKLKRPDEPFLCFQRRAKGDLLLAEMPTGAENSLESGAIYHKICGSAQRKRRGAVLQHGGVLLAQSVAAPELPGLTELASFPLSAKDLWPIWQRNLLQRIGLDPFDGEPTESEQTAAKQQLKERFSNQEWIKRR